MQRFNTRVTSDGRPRNITRLVAVSCGALVVAALAMPQAHAAGTIGVSATFEGATTVGDAGNKIVVTLTNSGPPATISTVNVLPSCAGPVTIGPATALGCANPDPGVFKLSLPAAQPAGACPGTFTVGGELPSGIVPINTGTLTVPTGSCTITLLEETLRAPKVDLDTTAAGIQTNTGVSEVDPSGETSTTGTPAQVTVMSTITPTAAGSKDCTANTPNSANGNGGFCNNGNDDVINNGNGNGGNFS